MTDQRPLAIRAEAVFDDVGGVVHLGGQLVAEPPIRPCVVRAEPSWGPAVDARSGALGAFGMRIPGGPESVGASISVHAEDTSVEVLVR